VINFVPYITSVLVQYKFATVKHSAAEKQHQRSQQSSAFFKHKNH